VKLISLVGFLSVSLLAISGTQGATTQPTAAPIRILVISGGDNTRHTRFYNLFKNDPGLAITEINEGKLTDTTSVYDRPDLLNCDVLFLYDFQTKVTEAGKKKFLALFDKGIGLIALHDALLSYQDWPDYHRIIGGDYLLDFMKVGDKTIPPSDVGRNITIHTVIADPNHPVTAGIKDFTTYKDELYRKVPTGDDIHVLCTAEDRPLIWSRSEKNSRVVTCMLGHGPPVWNDLSFQKILANAVHWTARRN
jgi:type 1 glutamine amidotransferase